MNDSEIRLECLRLAVGQAFRGMTLQHTMDLAEIFRKFAMGVAFDDDLTDWTPLYPHIPHD